MFTGIMEMLSDGDKESLDRYWFASLPSVRSGYYVRNGELYVGVTHRTPVNVLTYPPVPVRPS